MVIVNGTVSRRGTCLHYLPVHALAQAQLFIVYKPIVRKLPNTL